MVVLFSNVDKVIVDFGDVVIYWIMIELIIDRIGWEEVGVIIMVNDIGCIDLSYFVFN